MNKIPCSVCILTHNSEATLERALDSVKDFDEILICDGNSSDSTLDIAARYGARIIPQDPVYKDTNGRIIDFAGVRNQCLHAAKHDWIFALDSDEYITPELVEEIRIICAGTPITAWILRKYEFNGVVIQRALNYPSRQMRFFHRFAVCEYIKPVHERIEVKEGAPVRTLREYMIVPIVEETFDAVKRRWGAYIELERTRRSNISFRTWVYKSAREVAIMGLYSLRLIRLRLFQRGARFPLHMEVRIFWYQAQLIRMLFYKIDRV